VCSALLSRIHHVSFTHVMHSSHAAPSAHAPAVPRDCSGASPAGSGAGAGAGTADGACACCSRGGRLLADRGSRVRPRKLRTGLTCFLALQPGASQIRLSALAR
jgi:hypothetical protein